MKMVAFVLSLFAAMFSASTGYGLLKMLLQAMNSGTNRDSGALYTWRSDYRFLCARWVERVCSKKDTVSVNTIAAFLSSLACAFGDASEMRGQR